MVSLIRYFSHQTKKFNRRTLPFMQAMEDIKFCAVDERNYLILKSICQADQPHLFDYLRKTYYQDDLYIINDPFHYKFYYDGNFTLGGNLYTRIFKQPYDDMGLHNPGKTI